MPAGRDGLNSHILGVAVPVFGAVSSAGQLPLEQLMDVTGVTNEHNSALITAAADSVERTADAMEARLELPEESGEKPFEEPLAGDHPDVDEASLTDFDEVDMDAPLDDYLEADEAEDLDGAAEGMVG